MHIIKYYDISTVDYATVEYFEKYTSQLKNKLTKKKLAGDTICTMYHLRWTYLYDILEIDDDESNLEKSEDFNMPIGHSSSGEHSSVDDKMKTVLQKLLNNGIVNKIYIKKYSDNNNNSNKAKNNETLMTQKVGANAENDIVNKIQANKAKIITNIDNLMSEYIKQSCDLEFYGIMSKLKQDYEKDFKPLLDQVKNVEIENNEPTCTLNKNQCSIKENVNKLFKIKLLKEVPLNGTSKKCLKNIACKIPTFNDSRVKMIKSTIEHPDTFKAWIISIQSIISVVEFLLKKNYKHVFTKSFNLDPLTKYLHYIKTSRNQIPAEDIVEDIDFKEINEFLSNEAFTEDSSITLY